MKKFFISIWRILKVIFGSKYLAAITIFIIWITFIDTYNLIDRYKNLEKLKNLKKEAEFFRQEIESLNIQHNELFSDKKDLEKFAREQFLMKEENEDIFIIVKE
ncbi:MAG: septum formation initiator family protein [Bacteroidales bacterium]|jgi:cell division protein FtsB|nr:septum formation initiator family protein [Bacteroidales bacterium]